MWFLLCIGLIAVDQLIKWGAVSRLSQIDTYPIIANLFHLTYVENRGAAFGIFQNKIIFLAVLTFIELSVILWFFIKKTDNTKKILRVSLILIMAGAIGNFIDRIFRGFVVDLFDFRLINFYVFNFADVCICLGVAVFIFYIIFLDGKNNKGDVSGA